VVSAPILSPDSQLARVRAVARALDSAIQVPGTRFRIGLDPLLGLLPGVGDLAGGALSAYIVLEGARLGAPRRVVLRMLGNVLLDSLFGSIPVLGDLFDATWKANQRNVALLERYVTTPEQTRRSSTVFLVGVAGALIAMLAVGVIIAVQLARWLF
jgi:hypothetical protein